MGDELFTVNFSDGSCRNMRLRLANAEKPPGPGSSLRGEENRVAVDAQSSYVALKSCRKRFSLRLQNGVYFMAVRVGGDQAEPEKDFQRQARRP